MYQHGLWTKAYSDTRNDLYEIPQDDKEVYDMICRADTIGVFQIESRAQMSMLPRLQPMNFYDLVVEIAIVRPGPIQGQMVHPYLRRRKISKRSTIPNPPSSASPGMENPRLKAC